MSDIKLFEEKKMRTHWDAEKEQWYFSVIDVVEILTGSSIPKRYWSDLKKKLAAEGSEVYEKIVRLKLPSFLKQTDFCLQPLAHKGYQGFYTNFSQTTM
jgi:hypothetical protein